MDSDSDGEGVESFCEEEAPEGIPQSLLSYFETSRSRAVVCEKLILEDSEDGDLNSVEQLQINNVLVSELDNADSLSSHFPHSEEANCPEMEEVLEEHLMGEKLNQSEEFWMETGGQFCDSQKMEEQRRQRESEFELELRRLEEAEKMQQVELELMAKRAKAKLEQEMLLQQEMMKDLKKRIAEESKRRLEEQLKFKQEQERRREEERRKTEALRQWQKDAATLKQTEEIKPQLGIIKTNEVVMDGLGKHSKEEERTKASVGHTHNREQDKAPIPVEEVNLNVSILGSTYNNKSQSRQEVLQEAKWTKLRKLPGDSNGKYVLTACGETQSCTYVMEKVEQTGEEQKSENRNDRKFAVEVSNGEELHEIKSKVGKGRNGDLGITNKTQKKGNISGKEEEDGVNCDEDQNNLHEEDGIETEEQHTKCFAADERNVEVQHYEKATVESKNTPKDMSKKKILTNCNLLCNRFELRQETTSFCGKDGCGIKMEIGEKDCENYMTLSSNASPNVLKICQEKGQNSSNSSRNKRSLRSDYLQNELGISEETDQNKKAAFGFISLEEGGLLPLMSSTHETHETALISCKSDNKRLAILETRKVGEAVSNQLSSSLVKFENLPTNDRGKVRSKNVDDNNDKCSDAGNIRPATSDHLIQSKSNKTPVQSSKIPREKGKTKDSNKEDKCENSLSDCEQSWSTESQDTNRTDNSISLNRKLGYDVLNKKYSFKQTSSDWKTTQNESDTLQQLHDTENAEMQSVSNDPGHENCEEKVNAVSSGCDLGRWEATWNPIDKSITKNANLATVTKEHCSFWTIDGNSNGQDYFEEEFDTKYPSHVSNICNQDIPGPTGASKTMDQKVKTKSICSSDVKNDENIGGQCCDEKDSSRTKVEENDAKCSNNNRSKTGDGPGDGPGDGGTYQATSNTCYLENLPIKSQEAQVNKDITGKNLHGDEVFLNQASTANDLSKQVSLVSIDFADVSEENSSESLNEVGLKNESPSLLNVNKMLSKNRTTSQDEDTTTLSSMVSLQNASEVIKDSGLFGSEENNNESDILNAIRECTDYDKPPSYNVQPFVFNRHASPHGNKKQNMAPILEAKKHFKEDSVIKNSSKSAVITESSKSGHNRSQAFCDNITDLKNHDMVYKMHNVNSNIQLVDKYTSALIETALNDSSVQNVIAEAANDHSSETAILRTGKEEDSIAGSGNKDQEVMHCNAHNSTSVWQNVQAVNSEINVERHNMGFETGSCWSDLCLPEQTEMKRLQWMRECIPWSKLSIMKNTRTEPIAVSRKRGPKRGAEVDSLPPLPPQTLLHNTGLTALTLLTTVSLQDLSCCSLSTLSQCLCLQSLSLRRCGLRTLEHINNLQKLCYIDAEENEIMFVDCENMSSLRVLRLGCNRLSTIHGLNGAYNLAELDLSHNLITRIAGVESLHRLQSLSLSHNQLISSRGIFILSSLLHLDLSHNQLDSVQGLDRCALLCTLHLSGNSLTQPPDLKNQVLIRELYLDDNSISSLHSLTEHWLPMMQHLTVAQNSLTELPSMSDFVCLETLDLQFNCISELSGVCENLKKCPFIRGICLEGNPLQQEPGWRSILEKTLPGLRYIDGQLTDSSLVGGPCSRPGPSFSPPVGSFLYLCQNQIQQTKELQQVHDLQISAALSAVDVLKISCVHLEKVFHLTEEHRFQHEFGETSTTSESERRGSVLEEPTREDSTDPQQTNEEALIQQTSRLSSDTEEREEREWAATVIQAYWRGVSLRRRLRAALTQAQCLDPGLDESLEELDMDGFVLDEASLDTDWSLTNFPDIEWSQSPKAPDLFTEESLWLPPVADFTLKQAWTSDGQNIDTAERTSPSNSARSKSPPSSAVPSGLSERSEKIVKEWGFKDDHTALLMLKRARKMKSKLEQQQKLKDPSVRLALFKSCSSQIRPTEPSRPRAQRSRATRGGETGKLWTGHRDQMRSSTNSESFLPKMSWDVLNGGRVHLVTDPGQVRVDSQSCPGISFAPRKKSEGKSKMEMPCPKRVSSAPGKKERISFRDNKLQLSGGWGSGKRRAKVCK